MSITTVRSGAVALAFAALAFVVFPSAAHADTQMITVNPGFESGTPGWANDATPGAVYSVSATEFNSGTHSAQVSVASYTPGTDAKWYFTPNIAATSTTQYYTFSDKYKSATTTSVFVYFSNGTIQWIGDASPSASAWGTFTGQQFTVAPNLTFTIGHALEGVGTLNTDDYSLLRAGVAPILGQGFVTLSFDDGWKSQFTNKNVLGSLKATFNIITGPLGSDIQFPGTGNPENPDYMSLANIQQLQLEGHEIADHTRTHPAGGLIASGVNLNSEIDGSRKDLLTHGITSVTTFAYPEGKTNAQIQAYVASTSFTGARGIDEGLNDKNTNPYNLFAYEIYSNTPLSYVQNLVQQATSTNKWVIFFFHKVDAACSAAIQDECITPTNLQAIANYLATAPAGTVITTSQGLAQMGVLPPVPVIAPHPDVTSQATSSLTGAWVTYTPPTATLGATVTCTPASGSFFTITPVMSVTCSAPGAVSTSFNVIVSPHAAPVAQNVATSTFPGVSTPITLKATGTGSLTFATTSNPKFGTLSGTGANLIYTPEASTTGFTDSFSFKANDGQVGSNVAVATINVSLAPDTTAPSVVTVSAGTPGQTDATITWVTSEPADSQIIYGTTASYGATTTLNTSLVTNHTTTLTGLTAGTTYYYAILSADAAGNHSTSTQSFNTASGSNGGGGNGCTGCGCGGCGGGGGGGFILPNNPPATTTGQVLGASTQVLTNAQIDAILGLLRSFDADQSVIDNVNRALRGLGGSTSGKYVFTKNLSVGSTGTEVMEFQKVLVAGGFLKVAAPTTYFGSLTKSALIAYQIAHNIAPVGSVGPLTRAELNK